MAEGTERCWEDHIQDAYKQYMETKPQSESIRRLYALHKVYKNPEDPLYKPIVDYTVSCTYRVDNALSELINPVIGKSEDKLKNSAREGLISDS